MTDRKRAMKEAERMLSKTLGDAAVRFCMTVLRITGLANGQPTPFDGKLVAAYDPTYHPPGENYDGGILEVTDDPAKALAFPDAVAAMEKWRESYGTRVDGRPNRPLTAFTVEVEKL